MSLESQSMQRWILKSESTGEYLAPGGEATESMDWARKWKRKPGSQKDFNPVLVVITKTITEVTENGR